MKTHYIGAIALATVLFSCSNSNKTTEIPSSATVEDTTVNDSISATNNHNVQKETITIDGNIITMIKVDGGKFRMGADVKDKSVADGDEYPAHITSVSDYSIAETEVTQKLWQDIMGENPSEVKGENKPVSNVSWNDCQKFLEKLNKKTGKKFRLPTEAEWEFAARGGNYSNHTLYAGSDSLELVGWFEGNNNGSIQDIKKKAPNELSLYDMSGNVAEWCNDYYKDGYYAYSPDEDPMGPEEGNIHVLRGSGWMSTSKQLCRVSNRSGNLPLYTYQFLGLRLAMDVKK